MNKTEEKEQKVLVMRKIHFMQKLPGIYPKKYLFFFSLFFWSAFLSEPKLSVLNNHQALQCLLTLVGSSNSQGCLPFICSQHHQNTGNAEQTVQTGYHFKKAGAHKSNKQ